MKTQNEIVDEIIDKLYIDMVRTNRWIYFHELIYKVLVEFQDKQLSKRIATRMEKLLESLGIRNVVVHYSNPYKTDMLSNITYLTLWGGDTCLEYNDRIHVNIYSAMKDLHDFAAQINSQKQRVTTIRDCIDTGDLIKLYASHYLSYLEDKERMETTLDLFGSLKHTVNLENTNV